MYVDVNKNHLKVEAHATVEVNGLGQPKVKDWMEYRKAIILWGILKHFGMRLEWNLASMPSPPDMMARLLSYKA